MCLMAEDVVEMAAELARIRRLVRSGQARAIRVDAGLSQGDIARLIGVQPGAVSRWEAGLRVPRGDKALAYGRVLARVAP